MATGNWIQLGYEVLASDASDITVEWTGHYENIRFSYRTKQAGSNGIDFQGKAGSNWKTSSGDYYYYYQAAADGSTAEYGVSSTKTAFWGNYGNTSELQSVEGKILNITGKKRLAVSSHTSMQEPDCFDSRWYTYMNNTADDLLGLRVIKESSKNDFTAGSSLTVWAHVDAISDYPNIPNGTIFEESDTGTHYMWDGTDTWNEVT